MGTFFVILFFVALIGYAILSIYASKKYCKDRPVVNGCKCSYMWIDAAEKKKQNK